jgi:hypothetical protein
MNHMVLWSIHNEERSLSSIRLSYWPKGNNGSNLNLNSFFHNVSSHSLISKSCDYCWFFMMLFVKIEDLLWIEVIKGSQPQFCSLQKRFTHKLQHLSTITTRHLFISNTVFCIPFIFIFIIFFTRSLLC